MAREGMGYIVINKILIVDDDIIFCNALKYHFSQKKYAVKSCLTCKELKNNININEFDLILLDLRLEDASGLDLLEYISQSYPDKRVIIVSSHLDSENVLKAKELGAYTCINKNSQLFKELDNIIEEL